MAEDEGRSSALTLRVLGPLEVEVGGRPLEVPSRLERAVLVALAVRVGRAVSVDYLAGALWGEDLPVSWRKSIQVRLSNLRQRLDQAGVVDVRQVLATATDGYSLRLGGQHVDATRFEALFEQGRQALLEGEALIAERALAEALQLWRDDPLPELADTATGQAEAARLIELRHIAQEERADAALALGRHAEVVGWVEAALVDQPLRERRWAQLMLALHRSGRQAEALRAYQRARDLLVSELGIEPGPALARLEQAVVAHDPELDVDPRHAARRSTVDLRDRSPSVAWARRHAEVPLVGRVAEWQGLRGAHAASVSAQQSAAIAVTGAAGMGKSRLVAELCLEAAAAGATVIRGQALPDVPLSLVRSVVQSVDTGLTADAAMDAPAVVDRLGDVLEAAAADQPLLIVLDDLQWADPLTVAVARRLLDRFRPGSNGLPTTLVGVLRPEPHLAHGTAEVLAEVRRFPVHEWIDLGSMPDGEIAELLSTTIVRAADEQVLELVVRASGGNPGVALELANHLQARGALDQAGRWALDGSITLATLGVPATIQASVDERTRSLSAEAVGLLSAMALYGVTFDVGEVTVIAAVAEEPAITSLSEAVSAGLVRELGSDRFAFATEVEAAVLAQRVSASRRSRVEARIAGSRIPWGDDLPV
jgi:DNA-binding SARP family transcriptional activator